MHFPRRPIATVALTVAVAAAAFAADPPAPEAQRLDNETFHAGLIEYELVDLLDFHLALYPPDSDLTNLLLQRKVKLLVWADETESREKRRAALREANALLARMISEFGDDDRALDWQIELARALIYEQAEPAYSSILYRGGTPEDHRTLGRLMEQAISVLERLRSFLEAEYARLDELTLNEYEQLDESGYVTKIEQAMPQAEYMLRWARFYSAIALEPGDTRRHLLLDGIFTELIEQKALLTTDHVVTHVQAQSLLLAGMSARRLGDYAEAQRHLRQAADVVDHLPDPRERRDLQWLITLATVERIRALRDDHRFDDAQQNLKRLQRHLAENDQDDFGRLLVLALLESSIAQARTAPAEDGPDAALTRPLTDAATQPLMALAQQQPAYRDEVYAAIYEQLADVAQPEKLHPFQQCAIIAGHIAEATRLRHGQDQGAEATASDQRSAEARAVQLLDAAINLAQGLVARREVIANDLYCEALFNLGVARHHRGQRMEAAQQFTSVASQCPEFPRALAAATYAVEIAVELAEDPTLRRRRDVQNLLVTALRTLVEGFPGAEAAEYWRFFLAQALEDTGAYDEAAEQYAQVTGGHPHRLLARFRAGRCLARALMERTARDEPDLVDIKRRAGEARHALETFIETVQQAPAKAGERAQRAAAEAEVLIGEISILPGVDNPQIALTRLDGFEDRHPQQRDLIGRVLRVRIVAYEATDRLADARQAVPQYIASAPDEAGPTLQGLFDATWGEIERYRRLGRDDLADSKARAALLFAEQIHAWAQNRSGQTSADDLYLLELQLAEAYLEAGQPAKALPLFELAVQIDADRQPDGEAHDPRALIGQARALYALQRYADALPLFNRVYREAPADARRRFAALLGDLRCRTELGEPADPIIAVIRQHRFLNPDLGSEDLKQEFAALEDRNQQR